MKILLLGGTELTLAVAKTLVKIHLKPICGIYLSKSFSISYNKKPINNSRHADLQSWYHDNNIPCQEYENENTLKEIIQRHAPDIALVVGWYHMISADVRNRLPLGCVGIHASLLPKLRGGAPLNWAIISELKETGVSLFELSDGVDNGRIYAQKSFSISSTDYIDHLIKKCNEATIDLITDAFQKINSHHIEPVIQTGKPSYCLQRKPEDSQLNWSQNTKTIKSLIRASSHPYSGAFSYLENQKITIWKYYDNSVDVDILGSEGQILYLKDFEYPIVKTGDGTIFIEQATFSDGENALPYLKKCSHKRFT